MGGHHGALSRCLRNLERQKCIPARRPIDRVEFAVASQVQISLHFPNREIVTDLGANPDHARLEGS
jgi:hypothetical protein